MYDEMVRRLRDYSAARKGEIAELTAAAAEAIEELGKSQLRWILCTERMPSISYDYLGNWSSEEVILLMKDEDTTVCTGHFNPVGVFEEIEEDGPAFVGRPVEDVIAWLPLPEPPQGG